MHFFCARFDFSIDLYFFNFRNFFHPHPNHPSPSPTHRGSLVTRSNIYKLNKKRTIVFPTAYGDGGDGGAIPPGATLTFDVELVNIERAGGLKADEPLMFDKIDTNKDLKISKEEMTDYIAKHGRLPGDTSDDHAQRTAGIFENEDKNKDGFISMDEFTGPKRDEL